MKLFKCRASASGKLMTSPRNKSEVLSETTKSYLKDWATAQIFGIQKSVLTKQMEKGIMLEDDAIQFASEVLKFPKTVKNEMFFEDDYFTGTPDVILDNEIIDIKVSWDAFTFPYFESELPTKDYFYQMQVYMHLTGKKVARVVYVLLNTPNSLVYDEPDDYSNIDPIKRVKAFEVTYDPEIIKELESKVLESRKLIDTWNIE